MKKLLKKTSAKIIAMLLILAFGCVSVLSAGAVWLLAEEGLYDLDRSYEFSETQVCESLVMERNRVAGEAYWYGLLGEKHPELMQVREDAEYFGRKTDPARTAYRYRIFDGSGALLETNIRDGEAVSVHTVNLIFHRTDYVESSTPRPSLAPGALSDAAQTTAGNGQITSTPQITPTPAATGSTPPPAEAGQTAMMLPPPDFTPVETEWDEEQLVFTVEGCIVEDLSAYNDEFRHAAWWMSTLYRYRNPLIAVAIGTLLACVALLVFLLFAAGRHEDGDEIRLSWFDRIPADLMLGCAAAMETGVVCLIVAFLRYGLDLQRFLLLLLYGGFLTAAGVTLLVLALMSVAVRLKTRTFLRNTVVFRVLQLCWHVLRWAGRGVRGFFRNLPLLLRWIAGFIVLGVIEVYLVVLMEYSGMAALVFLLLNLGVFVAMCMVLIQLNRLKKAGEALANGQMEQRVDTKRMFWDFKRHGENLNAIGDGISRAVTARLKSERMKTDLITNVSHDLKTPLTSIVNYIDLLQKEEIANETARGYVEVLERQAQRLKKLTTDLVEASKASSGVITPELLPVNATELMSQCVAEYAERFAAAQVTPVITSPESAPHILADGRLLWRVFDNLLGNVVKYSLPGTRVYCTIEENHKSATVSVKNISREPLNVSADELMERFVRGDASRSTEGSGLGLSIARSLVELMQGRFELVIDGDLFTAKVTFLKPAA